MPVMRLAAPPRDCCHRPADCCVRRVTLPRTASTSGARESAAVPSASASTCTGEQSRGDICPRSSFKTFRGTSQLLPRGQATASWHWHLQLQQAVRLAARQLASDAALAGRHPRPLRNPVLQARDCVSAGGRPGEAGVGGDGGVAAEPADLEGRVNPAE